MNTARCDFVRVLSAEDTCPQCTEIYAWVDQRVCTTCMMAVCPGCVAPASLTHDPLCLTCYANDEAPTRPIPKLALFHRRTRRSRLTLKRQGLHLLTRARDLTQQGAELLFAGLERTHQRLEPLARRAQRTLLRKLRAFRESARRARHRLIIHARVLALALMILVACARREAEQE